MPRLRATSCSVRWPSIHFSMTITRFNSFFVKVICSLFILTFSRISYTLTISQNNDTKKVPTLKVPKTLITINNNNKSFRRC